LLQVDEVYVSAYASIPAMESLGGGAFARFAPAALLVIAVPVAMLVNVSDLEGYLLLVAALFVPAFAVVLAHALRPERGPAFVPVLAWGCGFILYQWITPADVGWWHDALSAPFDALGLPFALSDDVTWLGAAIPAFLVAFCISLIPSVVRLLSPRPGVPQAV
jgi:hypothetical protein